MDYIRVYSVDKQLAASRPERHKGFSFYLTIALVGIFLLGTGAHALTLP
jgi:hypothetical protein